MGLTYKNSGVDVEGGKVFVDKITPIVKSTFSKRVIDSFGGFGALFSASFPEMNEPILVSGTDGVGTKLKIAQMMNKHDSIGVDAVAMCVNDILTSGAKPLFFLDYITCGRLNEHILVDVVKGIADGCKMAECSLVGGETAEHPDLTDPDYYDIAGFSVGIVDREKVISGSDIKKGDKIIGLASSGIHSNGFSLVRKLFFGIKGYNINTQLSELNEALGSVLLTPTRIYCKSVLQCIDKGVHIKGIVHITGGGFYDNIPRILPKNAAARIEKKALDIPPIFNIIQHEGKIDEREMFTTFNMGIGMMLILDYNNQDRALNILKDNGESPNIIGEIVDFIDEKIMIV